jgi:hypothetical protein
MESLRSFRIFTFESRFISSFVPLMILLLAPMQVGLASTSQLENPSPVAWTKRAPQPMQPLQRIDLGQA